jgi:hypothetical protein
LGLAGGVGAGLVFIACNVLPAFGPVFACISGELANGALEDPILLVSGCAGATLAALIQVIQIEIANLSSGTTAYPDASSSAVFATVSSSDAGSLAAVPPSPSAATVAYKAHLVRILDQAQALQAKGAK